MLKTNFLNEIISGDLDFHTSYELALGLRELDEVEIASILSALEAKGYDGEVVAGFAKAVRDSAEKVRHALDVIDTCGTGGDGKSTLNVSTASAIAVSTQLPVAKHGNRAITSSSGSADVLEKLGVKIDLRPDEAGELLKATNFTFLFAPVYHASFARVGAVRRKLGIRTIFNIVGPLANPASPRYQMIGAPDLGIMEKIADAMDVLGIEGVVVGGEIDEVSPSGETVVFEVRKREMDRFVVTPEDYGLRECGIIPCSGAEESAERIKAVFEGIGREEDTNFIAVNFATALYAAGKKDFADNTELFFDLLDDGAFIEKLNEVVGACRCF